MRSREFCYDPASQAPGLFQPADRRRLVHVNGWPYAEPVGAGRAGSDVTGMPGIDIEVKARRGFDPLAAMRQQADRAALGDLPFAILRMDGQGPAVIGSWPVILRLDTFTELLRAAGYGDQQETATGRTE
jgi:hypothetical protein